MTDIVIVSWNSGHFLKACVESILTPLNEPLVASIIIIDNNSFDNSVKQLPLHSKIKIVKNSDNKGFAFAANQGFKMCTATYSLLLNPDARLQETTLPDCIRYMQQYPKTDILGCSLLDDNGHVSVSCARFPTAFRFFTDAIGLSKWNPKRFKPALLMTDWDHKSSRRVNQVMGAFMFMPTHIFNRYGYFDERFFVYCEELDFSKRVTDAGGTIFFNHQISAVHSGKGTTENVKAFRLFLNLRSKVQYARKHFSLPAFLFTAGVIFVLEPATRFVYLLLKGNKEDVKQLIRGYQLLYRWKLPNT